MVKGLLLWFIKQTFYVFTVVTNFTNYWYGFKFSTVSAAKNFFNNSVIPLFSDILLNRDKIMVFYCSSNLGPIIYKDRQLCISSDTFLSISMTLLHLTFSYNKYNHLLFIWWTIDYDISNSIARDRIELTWLNNEHLSFQLNKSINYIFCCFYFEVMFFNCSEK